MSKFQALVNPVRIFLISTMIVNGGNYLYNLVLGRMLDPADFAEAGLMITLLLVIAFIAMTFQIVATKFYINYDDMDRQAFIAWIRQVALISGIVLGVVVAALSKPIATFFQINSYMSVLVFGISMPLYFWMSVRRGFLQGKESFVRLSGSYQAEMWGRFVLTILLVYFLSDVSISTNIAIAILFSIVAGNFVMPSQRTPDSIPRFLDQKRVFQFFILTASYECAQILINYSDILLVKHYFDSHEAGLYTSMALIGRMIYFVTWLVVMILIPKVLNLKKAGQAYKPLFYQYVLYIVGFSTAITIGAFLFSNQIVVVFFGPKYLAIADMLWVYGLATSVFAVANVFVYYFLSTDVFMPVYIAIAAGLVQVTLFSIFHHSLAQMIWVQVYTMGTLLLIQILYFTLSKKH